MLDDVIVITAAADDGGGFQTIAQRVGARPEMLLQVGAHSESAARTEHRRGELWAAHFVVAKWIRERAQRADEPRAALRLLGLDGEIDAWRRISDDAALRQIRDRLEARLAEL